MKKLILLFAYSLTTYCLVAQNSPPDAANDTLTVTQDNKLLGEIIFNDSDPENDSIYTTLLTVPDGGIEVGDGTLEYFCPNGGFCYQPDVGFVGVDTFTYVLTDSLGNMDTATVFLNVIAQDSITYGATLRGGCVVTVHPSCRAAFFDLLDPCEIPLSPSRLNRAAGISGFQEFPEWKSLLPPNDSCDFFALYDPPQYGTLYLTNVDSSNVVTTAGLNIDSLFYYEPNPLFIGLTNDSFGLLKCGELDDGEIYCDSIEIDMTIIYEEPCDYTDIEKYCCVSTTSTFPCDVLANDLALLDSIFPAPDYTVSGLEISNILMSPDNGMVNINGSMDSLIYDAGGFSGLDSLVYQTQFTVTDNITGQTITFMSSPQIVYIIPDDNCELIVSPIPIQIVTSNTLCVTLSNYLSVNFSVDVSCPEGIECTNDPLENYTLIPPAYLENDLICVPVEHCPPEVNIVICHEENPDVCEDVAIPLICTSTVPTLSEWGLIILSLLMLILGTVAIKTEQQTTLELSS